MLAIGGGLSVCRPRCRPDDIPPTSSPPPVLASTDGVPSPVVPAEPVVPTPLHQDFLDALTHEFPFGRERQSVLVEMLAGAPPEVVEALLRLSFGHDEFNDLSHVLIERLSTLAPDAALAFAREQRFGIDPPWWHSVIGGLNDPRDALGDLLVLPAGAERTRFVGHVALRLGLVDPDEAVLFSRIQAPPEARGVALLNAIFAVSRNDRAAGFELALRHGAETGEPALLRSLAVEWALEDLVAARTRIEALPEGEARNAALAGLAAALISRQ
ncbi:MAG: hypothetical protein ABII82_11830 [Verrucomicrobiota bacterium]